MILISGLTAQIRAIRLLATLAEPGYSRNSRVFFDAGGVGHSGHNASTTAISSSSSANGSGAGDTASRRSTRPDELANAVRGTSSSIEGGEDLLKQWLPVEQPEILADRSQVHAVAIGSK